MRAVYVSVCDGIWSCEPYETPGWELVGLDYREESGGWIALIGRGMQLVMDVLWLGGCPHAEVG